MKLKITHETTYRFNSEVFLEPHSFRLKPRAMPYLNPDTYTLDISPKPAGLQEHADAEGNAVSICWFEGMHLEMNIAASSVVVINDYNPFGFLVYPPDFLKLPFVYAGAEGRQLRTALAGQRTAEDVHAYCLKIRKESENATIPFLANLTRQIHKDFKVLTRETGPPHQPGRTFRQRHGSCRDLAWMQVHMLRSLGIASRFVSGYCYLQDAETDHELHAWSEAYLPGAGWMGMDPSHGIITGNTYIPLASSIHYDNAMPVSGTIRGKARSVLAANLSIEQV